MFVRIVVLPDRAADRVAVETFEALVVGMPPARSGGLAVVPFGTVHCARVNPQIPEPELAAIKLRLADANLPVSSEFTKR